MVLKILHFQQNIPCYKPAVQNHKNSMPKMRINCTKKCMNFHKNYRDELPSLLRISQMPSYKSL